MNNFIKEITNVLTKSDCDTLINWAEPRLEKSKVIGDDASRYESTVRTNSEVLINHHNTKNNNIKKITGYIKEKISQITKLPIKNQEGITILNYQIGQFYKLHADWFNRDTKMFKEEILDGGQRLYSILIYLNNVEEGGETEYPKLGLKIKPEKGKLIIHKNSEEGKDFPEVVHSALPPISGEKWVIVTWVRENSHTNDYDDIMKNSFDKIDKNIYEIL
jgi:prolyl 4-hydroxylase